MKSADRLEGEPAALVWERDRHVGVTAVRERVESLELKPVEVVEAVREHGRSAPGGSCAAALRGRGGERAQRSRGERLSVDQLGRLEAVAVGAVDRRDLLRVRPPRPLARPVAQRTREAGRLDQRATELGHEAGRSPHEAGLPRRLGEHVQPGPPNSLLDDQLALEVRRLPAREARSRCDLLEQPLEAHNAGAEDRPAVGELALGVLHVGERGHDQDGILVEAGAEPAQHLARLGGVGGAGYECERHTEIVATGSDRLTRAPRARRRSRARR